MLKNLLIVGGSLLVGGLAGQLALEMRLIVSPYEVGEPERVSFPTPPPSSPTPTVDTASPSRRRGGPGVQRGAGPDTEPHLREPGDTVPERKPPQWR